MRDPFIFAEGLTWRATRLIEYAASALGVLGAAWLAIGLPYPLIAWLVWIVSNVLFIGWAYRRDARGVMVMNSIYLVTSIVGASRYLR